MLYEALSTHGVRRRENDGNVEWDQRMSRVILCAHDVQYIDARIEKVGQREIPHALYIETIHVKIKDSGGRLP